MPLSEHEQKLLEQMEQALYADDPKFATNIRTAGGSASRGRAALGVLAVLAGLGLLLAGVAFTPALGVAGFTVMLNIIRPARFALSMAISPYFERIRKSIQRKFSVSPKAAAVLMIVFINLMGTCALMVLGVGLASALSGVPVWAAIK